MYPTGDSQMMFHYKKPFLKISDKGVIERQPKIFVSGLNTKFQLVKVDGESGVVAVSFYPFSINLFLPGFSLREITDKNVSLDDIFSGFRRTEERIEEAKDNNERIRIVENFLIERLSLGLKKRFALMKSIVGDIVTLKGNTDYVELQKKYSFSERQFERIFNSDIGVSPKRFSELIRFHNSVKMISSEKDLTSIAYDCGFYDQSHFIKVFKRYTGMTPKDFRIKYAGCEVG